MEKKLTKNEQNEQDQPALTKRAYTPPTLTVYGKLSDLTAGGMGEKAEGAGQSGNPNRQKP